ncbi:hypothetical protein CC80DRAFT_557679 [Byssothecium circinans]|uniref:Rhodopsin domain-containing protein n=1 Tax=Byssothecium circinans TaxID=147558 RepID=A0A6A5UGJ3_9PLEO|nr:hypothetical protein CC80DRAFT_557679 [Byssothecium circinans]
MSKPRPMLEYFQDDAGGPLMRTCIAFIVLETVAMVAYFTSRWIKPSTGPRITPYLMVAGYVFCMGLCVQSYRICKVGGLKHVDTMPLSILTGHLKKNKVIEWLYLPSVTFPKLAILILYTRVFAQQSRALRYIAYATGASMVLLLLLGTWAPYFLCQPFAYNWDKTIEGGKCVDVLKVYRWISFPNIITDLVLLGLCLPKIWGMKLKPALRVSLLVTFVIGNFGIVTSIIRFATFFQFDLFKDYTYNGAKFLTWTVIEPGVYFITACLITMRPLLRWAFKDLPILITRPGKSAWRSGWSKSKTGRSNKGFGDAVMAQKEGSGGRAAQWSSERRGAGDREGFEKLDDGIEVDVGGRGGRGRDIELGLPK